MFVVLSNKDSQSYYPDNTCSNFRVKLPRRLEVDSSWEVACVRFSFTQSLCTFHEPQSIFMVNDLTNEREVEIKVAPQRFQSIERLIKTLNTILKLEVNIGDGDMLPGLVIDRFNRVFAYKGKLNNRWYGVEFSDGLNLILGFGRDGFHYLDAYKTDLYLYLDCISQRVVGDTFVPLLTSIDIGNIKANPGEQTVVHIKKPEYTRVAVSSIEEVELQLRDDVGREPIFEYGTVTVGLHFRKRK